MSEVSYCIDFCMGDTWFPLIVDERTSFEESEIQALWKRAKKARHFKGIKLRLIKVTHEILETVG